MTNAGTCCDDSIMLSDAELLTIEFQTAFVLERTGRILITNDPDHSPAPRFVLPGCASGNICGVRVDVADAIAMQLMALAASEPPFFDRLSTPRHLDRYIELLSREGPASQPNLGMSYVLPNNVAYPHDARLICSDSPEGQDLRASWATKGIPNGLAEMGFSGDFWEPWCVALEQGEVASVAFAARLSETGACLGLATSPELRGKGYGAAATAGWARMLALRSRALFYGASQTNISSQRVIARLGLRFLGNSLALS
jgi:Acetyltransferase (GNAT) domain